MNFVLNVVFQFLLVFTKKKYSYKSQIIFSLIISIFSMMALPLTVIILQDLTSFIFTCLVLAFQGLGNAIVTSCFYGLISYLPFKYIITFSTGQGIAGLLLNATRYLILISVGSDSTRRTNVIGTLIFFGFSVLILIVCLICVFLVYQNPFFRQKMIVAGEIEQTQGDIGLLNERDGLINRSPDDIVTEQSSEHKETSFLFLMKILFKFNFLIWLNYFITFSVFPGIAIKTYLL